MAALTVTEVTSLQPYGEYYAQTFRTSALGTAAADEWIPTNFSTIVGVLGAPVVLGATTSTVSLAVELNAQGTGVAEGTNPGDLGIESTDAGINDVLVTVIGRP